MRESNMTGLITDAAIQAAMRKVKRGDKTAITITDAAPRGAGRLTITVRPHRAEWYAQRYEDGKKRLIKIGAFPGMSIAQARERFHDLPKPNESTGGIVWPQRGNQTPIKGMFAAYVESRADAAENSIKQMKRIFEIACEAWGEDRAAASITPADIVAVVKPAYDRGARSQADKNRVYLNSAFQWAMHSTYDYRTENPIDWGVRSNPVAAIARDSEADGVGQRWLSVSEYTAYLAYLQGRETISKPVRYGAMLVMLTGQRAQEILKIRPENWDSKERVITWEKTKNGLPHVLPVCSRAAALLDDLKPNAGGWLFANESRDDKPLPDGSLLATHKRYVRALNKAGKGKPGYKEMERFTSRDLRRTWKTLAGEAGLSKEDRDRLQNHTDGKDVASVHYDRYEYLREKRRAVEAWEKWIEAQIRKA